MSKKLNAEAMAEIIERIMTMHYGLAACDCWVCNAGRKAGCHNRAGAGGYQMNPNTVHVDTDHHSYIVSLPTKCGAGAPMMLKEGGMGSLTCQKPSGHTNLHSLDVKGTTLEWSTR